MALFLLFALMLLVMLMRVYLPHGARATGKVIRVTQLSLVERFLLQRVNLYAIGSVLLLMTVTGAIATGAQILVLLMAQALLLVPVRCKFTSDGVALNNVVFRPWSELAGFSVATRRIVLMGREGTRPLNLPLLADHQKEVLPILRRHLPEVPARKEARGDNRATVS
jgi:hypothetical protein